VKGEPAGMHGMHACTPVKRNCRNHRMAMIKGEYMHAIGIGSLIFHRTLEWA
jgi:hypothetical protein